MQAHTDGEMLIDMRGQAAKAVAMHALILSLWLLW